MPRPALLADRPQRDDSPLAKSKTKPRGRPSVPADQRRTQTIGVRVSPAELEALKAKSVHVGIPPASLLRLAALDVVPRSVPPVNREKWVELARTASNLNQLTRALSNGLPVSISADLLERLRVELHATRCALLGRTPDGRPVKLPDTIAGETAEPVIQS